MRDRLKINEIFYSVQGEGANAGMPAVFVRLSGCNLKCKFCDTSHERYKEFDIAELEKRISKFKCRNIIWTGGEPTLQLTADILKYFVKYYNCIETNGSNPVPEGVDYITCSPKVGIEVLNLNFPAGVHEIRYPVGVDDAVPDIEMLPPAKYYYVSPIDVIKENTDYCLKLIKRNPRWRLSVQIHKLLKIR